ncbi:TPA: hypothetical protein HA265_00605 [Candidatus Woesearchaeota archaeon]|nr:hypothetical protein [Candidatus Woesearchaeota archaeon]
MRIITSKEERRRLMKYIEIAADLGTQSTCKKSQRGFVIVQYNQIVGRGYNRPTVPDLCCMREAMTDQSRKELCDAEHAEVMGTLDMFKHHYHTTMDRSMIATMGIHAKVKDGRPVPGGEPSCPGCSILMLSSGIEAMLLWEKEASGGEKMCLYDMKEFNRRSLEYHLRHHRQKI